MNLWEIHRLGVVRFVAPNAEHGGIELRRRRIRRILCVLHLRSVTGFAGYARVATGLFHIQDLAVAGFADFVASIGNRLGHDFLEGVTPEMAIAAKALGDKAASKDKKENQARKEDSGHTKEVVEVFELNHRLMDRPSISNVRSYSVRVHTNYRTGVTQQRDLSHKMGFC
jgi:hypothetical protein